MNKTLLNNIENDFSVKELPIVYYPDESLMKPCPKVTEFNDNLISEIKNAYFTMRKNAGIGISAPQVGIRKQFAIVQVTDPLVIINPKIYHREGSVKSEEGCLSVPNYFLQVKRAKKIRCVYYDEHGQANDLIADGLIGICIQHEIDHLEGKMFIDGISKLKKMFLNKHIKKMKKLGIMS